MIIFKDLITGDEMFTDSCKCKLVDGCIWEVTCQHVTRKMGDVQLDGANPSAEGEDADEGCEAGMESGIDLVLNQRLVETGFTKADYRSYLKTYTKTLQEKWKELEWSEEKVSEAKAKLTEGVKKILPKVDDMQFFLGEGSNPDGMVALLEYRDGAGPDGSEAPIMIFLKHGLEEEKV